MIRRIRIDFLIAFIVAFGIGALVNFGAGKVIDALEKKSEEIVYSDTEIGAAAGKNTPVVSSIAEMMENDYFTFHTPDDISSAKVYYNGTIYTVYKILESNEFVLVDDYFRHSTLESDENDTSLFPDCYRVLPVGKVVKGQLDEELLQKLKEEDATLTDTSFYIDMSGRFKSFSREAYEEKAELISFLVGLVAFFIVRYLTIASGLFPPLFPLRFLKSWKQFVIYYGIIYYGDNMKQILSLRKQGKMTEAAHEFSKLAEISEDEALNAMEYWNEIYTEGILPFH